MAFLNVCDRCKVRATRVDAQGWEAVGLGPIMHEQVSAAFSQYILNGLLCPECLKEFLAWWKAVLK